MAKGSEFDYWKTYDALCQDVQQNGNEELAYKLKDIKGYVNGLTDGWYEFLYAFETTIDQSRALSVEHHEKGRLLIDTLKENLKK